MLMNRISHWIDGKVVESDIGPLAVVYNPATGEQSGTVDLATADEVDTAVAAAKAAFPAWRATSLSKRAEIMFRLRELVDANRKEIATAADRRTRQGAHRRPRRGRPRPREHRVRLRHPATHQGRVLRAGGERHRRVLDPPAARRRRRHHAVQLPGDGPDVDVRQRPRLRQHVRPQAEREGPVGVAVHGRTAAQAGLPVGCFNVVQGDKVAGRSAARTPGHRRAQLRRLDPDREVHLRDRDPPTASGCRRSAARRTTCSCSATPTSTWPPTPRSAPGTARPASAAWPSASCSPSDSIADELVAKIAERIPRRQGRPRQRVGQRDGPADHRRASRQGQELHRRCAR